MLCAQLLGCLIGIVVGGVGGIYNSCHAVIVDDLCFGEAVFSQFLHEAVGTFLSDFARKDEGV